MCLKSQREKYEAIVAALHPPEYTRAQKKTAKNPEILAQKQQQKPWIQKTILKPSPRDRKQRKSRKQHVHCSLQISNIVYFIVVSFPNRTSGKLK